MIRGTVIFKLTNVGSKSESEQPFLSLQEGVEFRIMAKGDNPFMHDLLRPYENKEVEIDGKFNERKIFIVTDIKEITPEAQPDADVIIAPAKDVTEEAKAEEAYEEKAEEVAEISKNPEAEASEEEAEDADENK